jgi:putative oxidoreductase
MDHVFIDSPFALLAARAGLTVFFAVLFIQSGFDKVFNFRENLSWLVSHFKKTFLSDIVPIVFILITLTEVSAGLLSAYGVVELLIHDNSRIAMYGAVLSMISLVSLFFGQRIAKDYSGASGLVGYFLASVIAILVLA